MAGTVGYVGAVGPDMTDLLRYVCTGCNEVSVIREAMPDERCSVCCFDDWREDGPPQWPDAEQPSWLPIDTLPPPGERPGRVFVLVEGHRYHNGMNIRWLRQHAGIAATYNEGFDPEDIAHIEWRGDMEHNSGAVTHWLPINLPPFPRGPLEK